MNRAITREELFELLERYRIGKKPLSMLLGWGQTTVLLYCKENVLPDCEYTRHLYSLYINPKLYISELNEGKDRISNVAYKKSMEAAGNFLQSSRIFEIGEYIVERLRLRENGEVSLLRLETVLFFSQAISLALFAEPLFEEDYQPGRSGLPYRGIEERFRQFDCCLIGGNRNEPSFRSEIVDTCCDAFSWYGVAALSEFMAAERYRLCGPPGARRRRVVSKELMKRCYHEVFEQAKVHKLKDVDGYIHKRIAFIRKNNINT